MNVRARLAALVLAAACAFGAGAAEDLDTALYLHGQKDYAGAFELFMKLAEAGDPVAQSNVGYYYDNGFGVSRNPQEAARWYRLAAENGDMHAQYNLAVMYETGTGVERDYGEAYRWFEMAAKQGDRHAAVYLGLFNEEGLGRPVDLIEAYAWFDVAAVRNARYGAKKRDAVAGRLSQVELEQAKAKAAALLEVLGDDPESIPKLPPRPPGA